MFIFSISLLSLVILLLWIVIVTGKTRYDKLLAVSGFGTVTVAFIAVYGFLTQRPQFLDIAILYAMINFIVTILILKYVKNSTLADTASQAQTLDTSNS